MFFYLYYSFKLLVFLLFCCLFKICITSSFLISWEFMWHFNCIFTIFIFPYNVDFNNSCVVLRMTMTYPHWVLDYCLFFFIFYLHKANFLLGPGHFTALVHLTVFLSSHRAHSTIVLLSPSNVSESHQQKLFAAALVTKQEPQNSTKHTWSLLGKENKGRGWWWLTRSRNVKRE